MARRIAIALALVPTVFFTDRAALPQAPSPHSERANRPASSETPRSDDPAEALTPFLDIPIEQHPPTPTFDLDQLIAEALERLAWIEHNTPPPTLRDIALARFAQLGAQPWEIAAFDCIGRRESGWTNKRSPTADDGTLQINDVHDPELATLGLDPYNPSDAADYSWLLYRRRGNFHDWTVAPACGLAA